MADKQKKETTPPPLLLMPAGGGLTLTPPDQPNVLMPVIQSEPSLFGPEDESLGEADSFVGQSPQHGAPLQPASQSAASFFHNPVMANTSKPDPFSQIGPGTPPKPPQSSTPPMVAGQPPIASNVPPLAPTSHVPATSTPKSMPAPVPNASGLAGLYRKHGSSRYAAMPEGTYSGSAGAPGPSPANLMSAPPAPTPFSPSFSSAPPIETNFSQNAGTLPPQPSMGQLPGMGYVPNSTEAYIPVNYHWCVCKNVEGRDIWYPFSMADSIALDDAFKAINAGTLPLESAVVSTDGGRYDVQVGEQRRYAVYWEEEPKVVRRCSWFYKREGDNRYVPYEESLAVRLEEEFKTAVTSGVWHKPLTFESGETVVMHSSTVMVHYQPSSQPDEWGNVQVSKMVPAPQGDQMRPRVVKRGVADFESIEEGEARQIDHLVFIVHGIGPVCDLRFRSIVECVDDFRTIGEGLVKSHFSLYRECNRIGRVEFLPVQWHQALHGDATGIDKRLRAITLPSTAKLRNFVNDTLMDVLFYTSPTYCQCIADTVGEEMNRMFNLFRARNPTFKGGVSVAGHSLGSCILFDLLQHQGEQHAEGGDMEPSGMTNGQPEPQLTVPEPEAAGDLVSDPVEEEGEALSLADLLAKVGLEDKQALFEQEQIDMESLIMCSESDLKDLGLPMGPRKKLQGFLREEASKKDKARLSRERRAKEEADRQMREKLEAEIAARQLEQEQARQNGDVTGRPSSMSINYIQGVGGTGHAHIRYRQLKFQPTCCFALGSPVGLFLSARGMEEISDEFCLPTCPKYFNIFHPFDPVAYRLEPLINPASSGVKPVLMPHHKGRKRLHLELKENLARMGSDIKQKIIDSLKVTWASINSFARAHQAESGASLEQQVESEMSQVAQQLDDDTASVASTLEEEIEMGQLNEGRRLDYQLQERPIESFNDYMFSLTSHGCYWNSEDTVLLVLKEIYGLFGIAPSIPGVDATSPHRPKMGAPPRGTPPPLGAQAMAQSYNNNSQQAPYMGMPPGNQGPPLGSYQAQPFSNHQAQPQVPPQGGFTSVGFGTNSGPSQSQPQSGPAMYGGMPGSGPPPHSGSLPPGHMAPPTGPPPFSMGQSARPPAGPPPMAGFVKKS